MPSMAGDDVALAAVKRKTHFDITFQRFSCFTRGVYFHLAGAVANKSLPAWLTGDIWMPLVGRVGWDLNLSRSSVDTGVRKWFWFHPSCLDKQGVKSGWFEELEHCWVLLNSCGNLRKTFGHRGNIWKIPLLCGFTLWHLDMSLFSVKMLHRFYNIGLLSWAVVISPNVLTFL